MQLPRLLCAQISRWYDDPYARGAWSVLAFGAPADARARLGKPVSDRILICGEATHLTRPGMVHGAWEEGERAAEWCISRGFQKVVVAGAGFCGLAAARRLTAAGVAVTLAESRDYVGGRARSRPLGSATVEMGANWLQQGEQNMLRSIAIDLGIAVVPTDFGAPIDLGSHAALASMRTAGLSEQLGARLVAAGPDARVSDILGAWAHDPAGPGWESVMRIATAELILEAGVAPEHLSVRAVLEPGVGKGDVWMPAGFSFLADTIAQGLDIRFGQVVRKVREEQCGVTILTDTESFRADAAVVTLPVAILRTGTVFFDPPLPDAHLAALAGINTGRVEKASLMFDRRWWPVSPGGYLRMHGDGPDEVSEWLDLTDAIGTPVLTGIFAGDFAARIWQSQSEDVVVEGIIVHMVKAIGQAVVSD